ncbi:hypothetical protein [Paractinoplanes atraurantiacus]|uniref:Enoyl-(Acyl carrier protein) reductase n=1 Tax=Paractinoplanes atraurantiacus TaxID=1036182 RepID=A0A285IRI1_9ACTN|nr:hypothetical protein [Actinoplanes atraurantiacus]SNY50572.1 hypothetical protein SAMN05421748_11144 [Actinoplanes atraurantiacus]
MSVALVMGPRAGSGRTSRGGWRPTAGRAAAFRADATEEQDVAGLVSAVEERLGPVRVLVPNATGPQPSIPALETTWPGLQRGQGRPVLPHPIPVERHAGMDHSSYLRDVPLGRMGTPAEVADVVAFLASGERITVNGGHAMD